MTAATTKPRFKHVYTDEERAAAIAATIANGGATNHDAIRKTAKDLGIPYSTLRSWTFAKYRPLCQQKAALLVIPLAERLDSLAHKIVGVLEDEKKMKEAPYSALVAGLTAAVDRARLLRGEPTSIRDHITPEQLESRLKELLTKAINSRAVEAKPIVVAQLPAPDAPPPAP